MSSLSEFSVRLLPKPQLVRLLTHLGLPAEFPNFKPAPQSSLYEHACGPPVCVRSRIGRPDDCQPDPQVDYEVIDPAPADD